MEITAEEVRALGANGATILDVGKHSGSAEIRGAVRYRPQDLLTPGHLALPIAQERPVILYDEAGPGDETLRIAERLQADGFDVRVLKGGFESWKRTGGPIQEPSLEQIVPPMRPSEVQELDRRV